MRKKLYIIIFVCLLPLAYLFPQTPPYYHYTSSDGLASSTVFDIIQDREGFIWFATLNGVSKFEGKRFTTFRINEGLSSNSIISLAEGKHGELYIGSYENGINVFRNGRIENYCNEIAGKSFALSYLLLVPPGNDEQKIYAYRSWNGINSIVENKNGELLTSVLPTAPVLINRLALLPDGNILALTTAGLFSLSNDKLIELKISGLPKTELNSYAAGEDGSYFIGTKGNIYKIKNNKVIERYKINLFTKNDVVSAILIDRSDNIWFSIMNHGFFLIPDGSDQIINIGIKMGLQNTLVNNYLQDNEGNIWISTFGKGVYCLNNLYLKSYNEKDGLSSNSVYSIMKEKSGKLLVGTFNGVSILDSGRFVHIHSNSKKTLTEYIYNIKNVDNEFYICASLGRIESTNISYKGIKLHFISWLSFCKTSSGMYLYGSGWNSILISKGSNLKNQSQLFLFGDSARINRVNEIIEDKNKDIWIGTSLGLCKLTCLPGGNNKWKKYFFKDNAVLNSKINSIFPDNKNCIWFAGENGIAKCNLVNNSITSYTNIDGYDLTSATSIVSDNKSRVWIGSMRGLFLYDGNSIKFLNMQTGIPSDEVLSLYYDSSKNILYIGTTNGFSVLDVHLFDNDNALSPNVKITSIKAGDSVYTNYSNLVFEPEQYDVSIGFEALKYSSPGTVKYKYKLNDEWLATDDDFINFISLGYGTYKLQIMAKAQNTAWGKPYFLTFRVKPRFSETIWFYIVIVSIFVIAFLSIIAWRLRKKTKKIKEQLDLTEKINKLKHQALSSMMNPHFIFNSLNSVQYLINCRRNEEANDYIAMMAKLIRKNLDTAGSGFIFLSEEINRLKLYLDLEKLRFQENFFYEIITGQEVDADSIMIPNMIIQPFVENSLWHGIIDSGSKGLLTISFSFEDVDIDSIIYNSLIIKVTDNGIGLKAAKKNKKEDHISKGIQIIEERLKLLSAKMQLPQPIMFEDLSSRDDNSHGTEVIISLPPPLYKIANTELDSPSYLTD